MGLWHNRRWEYTLETPPIDPAQVQAELESMLTTALPEILDRLAMAVGRRFRALSPRQVQRRRHTPREAPRQPVLPGH